MWEILQTLFMLGTLLTVLVNTSSIIRLTKRVEDHEKQFWWNHDNEEEGA